MKKILSFLVLFIAFTFPALAENIDSYDITIDIQESGELLVSEKITYNFGSQKKHGIYRDIPNTITVNSVKSSVGLDNFTVTMDGNHVNYKKMSISSPDSGENTRLRVGSKNIYISGIHTYEISYSVKKGVYKSSTDHLKDAIRWNVIGTGWKIPINQSTTTIYLPQILNKGMSSINTFTGAYGSTNTIATYDWAQNNVITINSGYLSAHEGLTFELTYPKDTLLQSSDFIIPISSRPVPSRMNNNSYSRTASNDPKVRNFTSIEKYLSFGIFLLFLLFLFSQLKKGFVDERSVAVQYDIPKDMTVLKAGLILDKSADAEDFAAAIIELAELGYLEIEDTSKESEGIIGSISSFLKLNPPVLTRTDKRDFDLSFEQKAVLNNILFKEGDTFTMGFSGGSSMRNSNRKKITVPILGEISVIESGRNKARRILEEFEDLNDKLYQWSIHRGYMADNPKTEKRSFILKSLLFILPLLALVLYPAIGTELIIPLGFVMIFPVVFVLAGVAKLNSKGGSGISGKIKKASSMVTLVIGTAVPLFIISSMVEISISEIIFSPYLFLILTISIVGMNYKKIGSFTQKGAEVQKQLLGLKEFIKTVESNKMERLLKEDPLFLEKLLPYAVLFNEAEHWIEFYSELNVNRPGWYSGNIVALGGFSSIANDTITPPSSSTGGSSGGGGFSGGGGGGGGGGSW